MALCALLRQAFPKDKLVAVFVDHNMQSRGVTESTDFVKDSLQKLGTFEGPLQFAPLKLATRY